MNERIKELMDDAGINSNRPGVEKFAELIIRECCDMFVELRTRPADLAVLDIKNRFGIK